MKKADFPLVLRFIAALTAGSTAVLILLYRHFGSSWMLTAAISFGTTAYHFVMRLAVGCLLPKATGYSFDYRRKWFQPCRREGNCTAGWVSSTGKAVFPPMRLNSSP